MNEAAVDRKTKPIRALLRKPSSILEERAQTLPCRADNELVYKRYAGSFEEMTDLPRSLRGAAKIGEI